MAEQKPIGPLDAATRIYQAAADKQLVREASSADGPRTYRMRVFGFEEVSSARSLASILSTVTSTHDQSRP